QVGEDVGEHVAFGNDTEQHDPDAGQPVEEIMFIERAGVPATQPGLSLDQSLACEMLHMSVEHFYGGLIAGLSVRACGVQDQREGRCSVEEAAAWAGVDRFPSG